VEVFGEPVNAEDFLHALKIALHLPLPALDRREEGYIFGTACWQDEYLGGCFARSARRKLNVD
jgi:hypothetical protein